MNKPKSLLLALLFLISVSLACSVSLNLRSSPQTDLLSIQANETWTNTHLQVNPGDQLTIIYQSGKWSPGLNETYDALGYGGDPRSANNVIKGVSHAALIGRIGHHQPFFVGEHYHHIVGESGMLYLGINDSDVGNNSGFLQVKVKIEEK